MVMLTFSFTVHEIIKCQILDYQILIEGRLKLKLLLQNPTTHQPIIVIRLSLQQNINFSKVLYFDTKNMDLLHNQTNSEDGSLRNQNLVEKKMNSRYNLKQKYHFFQNKRHPFAHSLKYYCKGINNNKRRLMRIQVLRNSMKLLNLQKQFGSRKTISVSLSLSCTAYQCHQKIKCLRWLCLIHSAH